MKLVVDVWADEVASKADFWNVVSDAAAALSLVQGEGWEIREVALQTHRRIDTGDSNDNNQD